jgi:hypothetical protein
MPARQLQRMVRGHHSPGPLCQAAEGALTEVQDMAVVTQPLRRTSWSSIIAVCDGLIHVFRDTADDSPPLYRTAMRV